MRIRTKVISVSEGPESASVSVSNDLVDRPDDNKRVVTVSFSGTFGIALNEDQKIEDVIKAGISITADIAEAH